jgi:hypothetical protein
MRTARTIAILAILMVLLIGAGLFAYAGLPEAGEQLPSDYYTSLVVGALAAILVGVGLMSLVFYSSRRGYDEPPRLQDDR